MFRFSYDTRGQSNEYSKMCLFVIYMFLSVHMKRKMEYFVNNEWFWSLTWAQNHWTYRTMIVAKQLKIIKWMRRMCDRHNASDMHIFHLT